MSDARDTSGAWPVLDVRTVGDERIPPGQSLTRKWPVLHYGAVPRVDLATWRFTVGGLIESALSLRYDELTALPRQQTLCDVHCVTRSSKLDNRVERVSVQELIRRARPSPDATHVLVRVEQGYHQPSPLLTSFGRRTCSPGATTVRTSPRSTDGRPASSSRTSTSGRAPSGCAGSSSWRVTGRAARSRTAIRCAAIPRRRSAMTGSRSSSG